MKRQRTIPPIGQGCKPHPLFTRFGEKTKECSCRDHFWLYLNVCVQCGENYHSVSPHKKTCSDKCRKAKSRAKNDKLFQTIMQLAHGVQ